MNLAGPTLLAHGTADQKARWLPSIPPAAELWCQLFSEPDAGSDLAAVRTSARPVDGGWQLNGRKVWTSYAQFADWGVCLARSDPAAPKHKGLSFFVVDMHAPGVDVHPLVQLTGEAEFNEVELDDVFVPDDQLVGAPGEGWRVAGSTLVPRTGREPPTARHPSPAPRRAPVPGGDFRSVRRHAVAPQAGPGLRGGATVPAAQFGARSPSSNAASSPAPKGAS